MLEKGRQNSTTTVVRTQKASILIIAPENTLTDLLQLELCHENYSVNVVHNGMAGLLAIRKTQPRLIIVDWSISCLSALDICYRLRSSKHRIPLLMITERSNTEGRVAAFDAGADDCISFPIAMTEFLARIRAHLRRTESEKYPCLMLDNLELNSITREVHRGEHQISLTAKEFDLLEYFMTHPRQVLTRCQILENIWGYDYAGDSNIIEVYVRYLRLKLEAYGDQRLIQTVRGVGYALRTL